MYQTNLKYNIETPPKYPQSFTGKERDSETGFSYFGARYYDSDILTGWLSVDPMADKYPNISPYAYCAWNPVKLVDPDGRMIGDYYTWDGKWLGHDKYNDNKVYVCDGLDEKKRAINRKDLGITHDEFREKAATVYGESSAYMYNKMNEEVKLEMYAIAYVHERNSIAYGSSSDQAKSFLSNSPNQNNSNEFRITANSAIINALTGGYDWSNGATQWDGVEQAFFSADDNRRSTGKWELHMNTMGWNISDEHYNKWKSNIGLSFKAPQTKKAVVGNNKGKIRLQSTAVYCNTIFWKIN